MTRKEHTAWARQRALLFIELGDLPGAVSSMVTDMGKHPECKLEPALALAGFREAQASNPLGVRRWVESFA